MEEYINRLKQLKMQSLEQYNQTMNNYKTNYPEFYNQLIKAMNLSNKVDKSTEFKMFLKEYKWYLTIIAIGIGVIIYLLTLLFNK